MGTGLVSAISAQRRRGSKCDRDIFTVLRKRRERKRVGQKNVGCNSHDVDVHSNIVQALEGNAINDPN